MHFLQYLSNVEFMSQKATILFDYDPEPTTAAQLDAAFKTAIAIMPYSGLRNCVFAGQSLEDPRIIIPLMAPVAGWNFANGNLPLLTTTSGLSLDWVACALGASTGGLFDPDVQVATSTGALFGFPISLYCNSAATAGWAANVAQTSQWNTTIGSSSSDLTSAVTIPAAYRWSSWTVSPMFATGLTGKVRSAIFGGSRVTSGTGVANWRLSTSINLGDIRAAYNTPYTPGIISLNNTARRASPKIVCGYQYDGTRILRIPGEAFRIALSGTKLAADPLYSVSRQSNPIRGLEITNL